MVTYTVIGNQSKNIQPKGWMSKITYICRFSRVYDLVSEATNTLS